MRCCSSAEERSADSTSETRRKAGGGRGRGGGGSVLTDDHTPESSKACWENRLERWLLRTFPVGVLRSLPGWRTLPGPPHFLPFWISVCPTFLRLRAKPRVCPGKRSRPHGDAVPPRRTFCLSFFSVGDVPALRSGKTGKSKRPL